MKFKEKIESLEQQIEALQSKIAVLKEVEKEEEIKSWVPEIDETYYYVCNLGEVHGRKYSVSPVDFALTKNLNAYKTREEAEFWSERFKLFRELSLFEMEKVKQSDLLHSISHSFVEERVKIFSSPFVQGAVSFDSKEMAQKAIDYVGKERLKKYWFRVDSNGD